MKLVLIIHPLMWDSLKEMLGMTDGQMEQWGFIKSEGP